MKDVQGSKCGPFYSLQDNDNSPTLLPQFFHFHENFLQKYLFAHPKISFAHPELPFLAKSMMVVISNTVFSFIPNDPCHNTLWNCIMDNKLVNLKSVIYLMHWKDGNFFQVALAQQSKFWETVSLDDLWSLLMLQQQEHLSYCATRWGSQAFQRSLMRL